MDEISFLQVQKKRSEGFMELSHNELGQSSHLANRGDNEIRLVMPIEENSKRLYEASKIGSIENLKLLIQEDPEIVTKVLIFSSDTETPLHVSVSNRHLEFSRFLSDRNPELVVEIDVFQRTPLHLASANGDIEMVRVLLEKNTSPCLVRDLNGLIPLHHAVIAENMEIVKELIDVRPQSVWTKLNDGQTILHLCVEHTCMEAMEFLMGVVIQDEVFFNAIDDNGDTILDLSLMLRRIEIIRYLLEVPGIKTGMKNNMDSTTTNIMRRRRRCPKSTHNSLETQQTHQNFDRETQQQRQQSDHEKQTNCSCWKALMKHLKYKGDWLAEVQGTLMLVASVIATMSFQGIISPPGGVWQQDYPHSEPDKIFQLNNGTGYELNNNQTSYMAGTSIMAIHKQRNYKFYLMVNSYSFLASVSVILLIISGFPLKNRIGVWILKLAMCAAVAFLSLSYLLGMMMINLPSSFDSGDNWSIYLKTILLWFWALGIVGFCFIIRLLIWVVKILISVLKRMIGLILLCDSKAFHKLIPPPA